MKYIVLLRGINISGKNKVDMKTLKEELLKNNLNNVITYLNNGNIILETDLNKEKLTNLFAKILETKFNINIPIFILNLKELEEIYLNIPTYYLAKDKNTYYNLIFLKNITYEEILTEIGEPSKYDKITPSKNVIYWSFDLNNYQKSNWWIKTASTYVKDYITIRNFNTIQKLYELANKEEK
ncbi:MAG: DUF1697 domain-containing protein [Erysipelotrichaceae bacterium]|nr:DUF1697 domain-containing protein [Erysipelotrichaceae bacterium]